MTRPIGSRTNVESLKKEAKQWLKALHAGAADALARFKAALPEHDKNITLRSVQRALAREHGLPGWEALTGAIDARERELREVADEMLRHAIFKGDPAVAARLFERHPEIARLDLFTAVATGNLDEVERRLSADPAAASRPGGPLDWPPLLYLTYMRLPGSAPQSLDIARALLDRGADPNARWNDDWANPFTALAGVIALGEGVKPPHERADELAQLLLERGADPYDTQAFYNTSIVNDDTHWLDVLWQHSERRGVTDKWRRVVGEQSIGGTIKLPPLDFMLSIAVSYNHLRRAKWLLEHGANPDGRHAYSQRLQREEALVYGNEAMAELLIRHGAADVPLQGRVAFQVACRRLDRSEARRLATLQPECLRDAEIMLTAAREKRLDIVELLLDLGMDVDIVDESEMRALNIAAGSGARRHLEAAHRARRRHRPTDEALRRPARLCRALRSARHGGGARTAEPRRAQLGFLEHEGSPARAFCRRACACEPRAFQVGPNAAVRAAVGGNGGVGHGAVPTRARRRSEPAQQGRRHSGGCSA